MERKNNAFYNNENTSSSSIPYDQSTVTSQISSVGFNNLKKVNSNSSQLSTTSASTIKTNPLTRLFTRNKSSSNFSQQQQSQHVENPNNSDDENSSDQPKGFNTNIIKLQKKNKLKLTSKSNLSKPDLSIQTSGHHNLRVSKKILSSSSIEDLPVPRKNSVSSPVSTFYSFFHRNHSFSHSVPEGQVLNNIKDDSNNSQKLNSNPHRTNVTLSSNSSNSQITDPKFAMIYNFTNPDYGIDEYDYFNEHNIFFDLQKKLMVPTDQYFQKLNKNQSRYSNSRDEENDYLIKYMVEFHKDNAKFFQTLQDVTKNLFRPSQQVSLSNGIMHPYLGIALEDISSYVKDAYISNISAEMNEQKSTSEKSPISKTSRTRSKYNKYSTTNLNDLTSQNKGSNDFSEFKIREISQDLLSYFTRSMIVLQNDSRKYEFQEYRDILKLKTEGINPKVASVIEGWKKVTLVWHYFNMKIRFFILGFFQPLQIYCNEISALHLTKSDKEYNINIESILMLAFRDVIIIPFLLDRNSQQSSYHRSDSALSLKQSALSSPRKVTSSPSLEREEKQAMVANGILQSNIVNCFGTIATQTNIDLGNSDGQQNYRNEIFQNAFTWLTST